MISLSTGDLIVLNDEDGEKLFVVAALREREPRLRLRCCVTARAGYMNVSLLSQRLYCRSALHFTKDTGEARIARAAVENRQPGPRRRFYPTDHALKFGPNYFRQVFEGSASRNSTIRTMSQDDQGDRE